ncbi:aminopeptidase [Corallococcus sp. bb12-1]|nr:aminopeptidase [Corallococcus sp. bb12-1]MCY1047386.1 aminopeptidase [Corallococcus sp. bb12-1]
MANSKSKHRRVQMKIRQHHKKRVKKQKAAAKVAAAEGKKK